MKRMMVRAVCFMLAVMVAFVMGCAFALGRCGARASRNLVTIEFCGHIWVKDNLAWGIDYGSAF